MKTEDAVNLAKAYLAGDVLILCGPTGGISLGDDSSQPLFVNGTVINMGLLPTANPHHPGELWNSGGAVMVSAG